MSRTPRTLPLSLCWLMFVASAGRLAFVFDALPVRLASHFDISGQPNGYQARGGFALTSISLQLFLIALFTSLPWLLQRLPNQLINMPNRDYWLAPQRR